MKSFKQFLREESEMSAPYYRYHEDMVADMDSPVHKAAADIHDAWMERNEKGDWNAHLHVPYTDLPREEQEKDVQHLKTVSKLMKETPVATQHPETGEELTPDEQKLMHAHNVANKFGSLAHEEWRKGFEAKSGKGTPRMKSAIDESGEEIQVNINVPWEELHPQWKQENYEAGLAAYDAHTKHVGSAQY